MIIGLSGTIGAGKGTVVEYLKAKGFAHYSSSKLLGELLDAEGKPKTRDNYSPLATRLQQEYPGGVVEKGYRERYVTQSPGDAIFEAIHRQSEADFIQSIGGKIIGVDADFETRYNRTVSRNEGEKDRVGYEEWVKQAKLEEEGGGDASRDNNIRAVMGKADAVISNNGTLEELHKQVDAALASLRA